MNWWTLKQLHSGNKTARKQAARKLGASKDTRAIQPLREALKDKDKDVRELAAAALGKIGSANAVAALLAVIRKAEEEHDVKEAAKQSMMEIGSESVLPLIGSLRHEDSLSDVVEVLSEIKDIEAFEPLALLSHRTGTNSPAHESIVRALNTIGSANPMPLLDLLKTGGKCEGAMDKVIVRTEATRVLSEATNPELTHALIEILRLENEQGICSDLSITVIELLSKIRDSAAVPVLTETLQNENLILDIHAAAAKALDMIGVPEEVETLVKAVSSTANITEGTATEASDINGNSNATGMAINELSETGDPDELKSEVQRIHNALGRIRNDHHQKKRQLEKMKKVYSDALMNIALGTRDPGERLRLREQLTELETDVDDLELTMKALQQRERRYLNAIRNAITADR